MLNKIFDLTLIIDSLCAVAGVYYNCHVNGPYMDTLAHKMAFGVVCLIYFALPSLFIAIIFIVIASVASFIADRLSWDFQAILPRPKSLVTRQQLVRLILTEEEEDNIRGDLSEEYAQFQSKVKACLWLIKQITTSICPLIYKAVGERIAVKLGVGDR